jgi:alpha-1,3-rhamnosyltransferase
MPDISVAVPSYNHAAFVGETLRSIFAQTLLPRKLIVIDDGSNDESAAVIERELNDCPFPFEFIARENKGLSATLNEAFALAKGDYFAYLGSDDLWLPEFLEEQSSLLEARPQAVLAFAHAYVIDERDNIIDTTDNWSHFPDGDLRETLLQGEIFPSPGVLYRHSAIEGLGWNTDSILEDYELYLRLSAKGDFARNSKRLCAWRLHGKNTSGDFPKMLNEHLRAQDTAIGELGLTRDELDKYQSRLKFKGVADCVRSGRTREARKLFWGNLSGARSFGHLAATALRTLAPQPVVQWVRSRKRENNIRQFGKLRIDKVNDAT